MLPAYCLYQRQRETENFMRKEKYCTSIFNGLTELSVSVNVDIGQFQDISCYCYTLITGSQTDQVNL